LVKRQQNSGFGLDGKSAFLIQCFTLTIHLIHHQEHFPIHQISLKHTHLEKIERQI